ncbi:MAG TPA: tRNA (N6-isopentenyl adenosine(37)-C2)-methylthiotransferase MiaB [Spirochaetota bacterium]|nr:tRNA (N6-isopentenyl adenosine(37)-C2)-methylthiotransferase MiaB [Spirochaetota bacterium]
MKTFYIETFGCQMNKGDSDLMALSMKENGFDQAASIRDADICIFNTCSVRKHAEERALARIRQEKGSGARGRTIVIAGCMAQRMGDDLLKSHMADIVIGPYQSPRIGEIITSSVQTKKSKGLILVSQDMADFSERITSALAGEKELHPWHKWVTITHGCENFCTYCIVPYVRGKLISFPSDRILKFIEDSVNSGVTEISLLGQNVNQYGLDSGDIPFWSLLDKAASIKGLVRVNFLTSHPMDFNDEIIRVIAGNPIISRGIHLPLQSGSDRVLELMNRKYTMTRYHEIIDAMHRIIGDFAISTDLIVGFPGETVEEFHATLDAVRRVRFDSAFMYAYSPREGTPSFSLREDITHEEKIARLNELIYMQREISLEKLKARINKTEKAIADKVSKKSGNELSGRTVLNHFVVFNGEKNDIGKESLIRILDVRGSTLVAEKI